MREQAEFHIDVSPKTGETTARFKELLRRDASTFLASGFDQEMLFYLVDSEIQDKLECIILKLYLEDRLISEIAEKTHLDERTILEYIDNGFMKIANCLRQIHRNLDSWQYKTPLQLSLRGFSYDEIHERLSA